MQTVQLDNAMLVSVSIGQFNNTRQDRAISDEVKLSKALGQNAGRWVKVKLPPEALEPISSYAGEVRRWLYSVTLPWIEGQRLLPAAAHEQFRTAFESRRKEFHALVDAFGAQYPQWIAQARIMHNGTFNADDYPAWEVTRSMFSMTLEYAPLPKANHFVLDLAKGAVDEMKKQLEANSERRLQQAIADLWVRLLAPVQHMADVLREDKPRIFESIVENVKAIASVAPGLNVTGDSQLGRAIAQINTTLAGISVESLRDNKVYRKETFAKAQAVVAQFGALGKRKFATNN